MPALQRNYMLDELQLSLARIPGRCRTRGQAINSRPRKGLANEVNLEKYVTPELRMTRFPLYRVPTWPPLKPATRIGKVFL